MTTRANDFEQVDLGVIAREVISDLEVTIEQDSSLLRASDEPLLLGDNSRLRALGWEPRIPFRQTLEDIYKNWIERLKLTAGAE